MPDRITSKSFGTVGADALRAMTGLQFVQGLADGTLRRSTMATTLGYDVVEATKGRVVVATDPTADHLNFAGNRRDRGRRNRAELRPPYRHRGRTDHR